MKKTLIERVQMALVKVSLNSVGRSIPAGIYERKIPEVVLKAKDAK
jgi:hypothetical protein